MTAAEITTPGLAPLTLRLWREHDAEVHHLPGIGMGELPASGDATELVAQLYEQGLRRVGLSRPVDLTGGMDEESLVWVMVLLRELTSRSIAVDWELRLGPHIDIWHRLNHLCPPRDLPGEPNAEEILQLWRETFYLCKCAYRRGPGFVEVRDRRAGSLSRFIVDDPEYLAAIDLLLDGTPVSAVPEHVLAAFVAEGLAGTAGNLAWWLPYRIRRWPWPSMIV
ncbi:MULTISPECIES: DUF5825 family protein [Actinoalloteichus]|uniref:Uncharacterized protein n=1 Tax=Actinoalloteichus fjordicus TaxID=1612552 RepID=A0AAC9PSH3_9PSEU|nr:MULTISPECIES: DUF5825 family protein [Actinoalloteichus]APU15559.1 hypothetical protein UA74_17655 [Actinoalloteichus fjordicus]APU21626.1 hypothetical protein UA75_18180 [Actinoalloteichus sp. GBA129-24]